MRKQLRKRTRTPGQRDQAKTPVWKNTLGQRLDAMVAANNAKRVAMLEAGR